MLKFYYTAKDKSGELISSEIEAENESSAAKILIQKKLFPIIITEKKKEKTSLSDLLNRVSFKQKTVFARQFATLISAGLPVVQSLETLYDQIQNPRFKKIIKDVINDVEGGTALSAAFSRYPDIFSKISVSMISSGEQSGTLDKVLDRLANQMEKEQRLRAKIKGAMVYPAVILVVIVIVIAIMMIYVMPKLADLYADFGSDLPFITRLMINTGNFLVKFWWFVLIVIIVFIFAIRVFIKTPYGRDKWDRLKIKIPVFGNLFKKIYLARLTRTLSTLVSSGVAILDGLGITAEGVGNTVFEEGLMKAASEVKSGSALSEPLRENKEFPIVVSQMLKVGEQTGEIDKMLDNLANFYEEEVDNMTKAMTTLMEPLIIVIMAVVVGTVILAIMMPIYGLSNVIFKR